MRTSLALHAVPSPYDRRSGLALADGLTDAIPLTLQTMFERAWEPKYVSPFPSKREAFGRSKDVDRRHTVLTDAGFAGSAGLEPPNSHFHLLGLSFTKAVRHRLFHETPSVVRISAENVSLVSGAKRAMPMPQTWQRLSQSRGGTSKPNEKPDALG